MNSRTVPSVPSDSTRAPKKATRRIVIISGPTGSGKTETVSTWEKIDPTFARVITTTSREPRVYADGRKEIHGIDYFFTPVSDFQKHIRLGYFLEWATVHGNLYGPERSTVLRIIESGRIAILNIDVQGHASIMNDPEFGPLVYSIFTNTSDFSTLEKRIRARQAVVDETDIARRLERAREEIAQAHKFDRIILTDTYEMVEAAIRDVIATVFA